MTEDPDKLRDRWESLERKSPDEEMQSKRSPGRAAKPSPVCSFATLDRYETVDSAPQALLEAPSDVVDG